MFIIRMNGRYRYYSSFEKYHKNYVNIHFLPSFQRSYELSGNETLGSIWYQLRLCSDVACVVRLHALYCTVNSASDYTACILMVLALISCTSV
jgi:hypothetical protein